MNPVAIFRHSHTEGAGHFALFLNQQNIPWQMIHVDLGEAVPSDAAAFSGLVFMGGPMSVNDDLPWIPKVLALIRDAYAKDIPLLGHCLGGQLMSKSLGGVVTKNPIKELGWGKVNVADNATAHEWFGDIRQFDSFHWHGETFSLPQDSVHLLSSAHCANQAWAIGKHLAMQCHVEMTEQMIRDWCRVGADEIATNLNSPAVQTAETMQAQMSEKLPHLHKVAEQLYRHWLHGIGAGTR
ncbi:MAG: type 1 glutamine amidotransferase [Gammaproteobacteria bacterium]|nr:type 1 glutamine amidotransferase [Gammaproteobacteria bacterium]MBU1776737.1 type 1 glutamine amidotransferase [Gammaproteobacteria bacterium]MBU1968511.1 type 1 glutamine amidotransferase [Gammaproteobacteria bacterium]